MLVYRTPCHWRACETDRMAYVYAKTMPTADFSEFNREFSDVSGICASRSQL